MFRHVLSPVLATFLLLSSNVGAQEPNCCGPCICSVCAKFDDERMAAKWLLDESSELFFGTVIAQELLSCCDSRAAITFRVLRRWKGAEPEVLLVRTPWCMSFSINLGSHYLVSAISRPGEPPILNDCYLPVERAASHSIMSQLDKIRGGESPP